MNEDEKLVYDAFNSLWETTIIKEYIQLELPPESSIFSLTVHDIRRIFLIGICEGFNLGLARAQEIIEESTNN